MTRNNTELTLNSARYIAVVVDFGKNYKELWGGGDEARTVDEWRQYLKDNHDIDCQEIVGVSYNIFQ